MPEKLNDSPKTEAQELLENSKQEMKNLQKEVKWNKDQKEMNDDEKDQKEMNDDEGDSKQAMRRIAFKISGMDFLDGHFDKTEKGYQFIDLNGDKFNIVIPKKTDITLTGATEKSIAENTLGAILIDRSDHNAVYDNLYTPRSEWRVENYTPISDWSRQVFREKDDVKERYVMSAKDFNEMVLPHIQVMINSLEDRQSWKQEKKE